MIRGLCTVALFVGSAAVAAAQSNPATSTNIVGELEEGRGSTPESVIYISNHSSQNIIVTSVRLIECENVQGSCGAARRKIKVNAGGRVMVLRVRPRFDDQSFSFRYTYAWEPEAPEGPTAKEVMADSTILAIDTVIVDPKILDIKVGETLNLSQVLAIKALNKKGDPFPEVWFSTVIETGAEYLKLEGGKLTGVAVGKAVLTVVASRTAGPTPPGRKGAGQILVTVVP